MPATSGCSRTSPIARRTTDGTRILARYCLGTGFGLRYDLDFLVLRADLGIGLHTPYPNPDKPGYYNIPSFKDGLGFHLAIGYPF